MSLLLRRTIPLQYYTTMKPIISCRHFVKSKSYDIANSIKSQIHLETLVREKSLKVQATQSRVRSPSGYQHVKRQLQQCKNTHDVMSIMSANKKCEDVQVGTRAIKSIKILHENRKVSKSVAIKQIDEIWDMMTKYVVGMDLVAYNEYFHACTLMAFSRKCRKKFDEMLTANIIANEVTLKIVLGTCIKTRDIASASYFWNTIVVDMKQCPNALCWASFLAVCATSENVELAEEYFEACPYKMNADVCYRMMSVYKHIADVDSVLAMKQYMEEQQMNIDDRIYNTIAAVYRNAKQPQQAINMTEEAISKDQWNSITITHLSEAIIELIKITDDYGTRVKLLKYIESDVVKYYEDRRGDRIEHLKSNKYGNRMLDAYVSTYKDFGSATFEECCHKYNISYWVQNEQVTVPTVNLLTHSYSVAKVILHYIFEKEITVFRDLGLNILITDITGLKYGVVNQEDVNSILSSLATPMNATKEDSNLLHVSSEQTKHYDGDEDVDDEPLFRF